MLDNLSSFLTPEKQRSYSAAELLVSISNLVKETRRPGLIHPHGFCVIPLHRDKSSEWRLHVWPRGPRAISGMPAFIHTHDVAIESRLLAGKLTNIIFDVSDIPVGGSPLYEVVYCGDKYAADTKNLLCIANKRVEAKPVSESVLGAGDFYDIQAHEFHEALVDESIATATLVRMHNRSPGTVRVVGLDGYPDKISFTRQPCPGVEIMDLLGL